VINNAGILRDKTLAKMEPENWDAVMDVHLRGAYNVTRPSLISMRENRYGRIVLTTSAAGLYGNFGQANYSAAKMGLVGFMNTLKLEGEKHNIRVNTVAPMAATRLTEDILPPDLLAKLKPEFVAPLVLYFCSDQCKDSGLVINAGMGYFNRAAILTGQGAVVGGGTAIPTPDDIHRNWEAINDLGKAAEYPNSTAAFGPMLEAFDPGKKKSNGGTSPGRLTVKAIFDGLPDAFRADRAAGIEVVFQFVISGPEGGSWYAAIQEGSCEVSEGTHGNPTSTIKMADVDFVTLIKGELNAMSAFTSGKLRVEGDLMKSQLVEKLFKF
jgi:putative sterol carrier protein